MIAPGCHTIWVSNNAAATFESAADLNRLATICRRYGVSELSVFGSAGRGDATGASDVDLLYLLEPGSRLGFAINDLEDELSEVFGRPVDLVSKRALHPLLREKVLAEAQVLYAA